MVSALPCYGAGVRGEPRAQSGLFFLFASCAGNKHYWQITVLRRCLGIIVPAVLVAAVPALPA